MGSRLQWPARNGVDLQASSRSTLQPRRVRAFPTNERPAIVRESEPLAECTKSVGPAAAYDGCWYDEHGLRYVEPVNVPAHVSEPRAHATTTTRRQGQGQTN